MASYISIYEIHIYIYLPIYFSANPVSKYTSSAQ